MSELKAFEVTRKALFGRTCTEKVYLKSEADKVIADLEESRKKEVGQLLMEIAELKKQAGLLGKALNTISESHKHVVSLARKCNHANYKRCLAMAKWCLTEKVYFHYRYDDWGDRGYDRPYKWKKVVFWSKWARRWLELAEKFKEAK